MKITSESRQTSFQYTQQLYVVKRSYHKPSFSDCHCCSLSLFFWIVVKILFHQQISIFFLLHSIAIDVATVEIFKHFLSLNTVWIFPQGHVWEEGTFVEQYCCTAILLWLSFQFHLSLVEIDEEQDEDWGKKFKRYQKKEVLSCTSPPSTYCMNVNFYLLCIFLLNIYKLKTFQCRIDRERVLLKSFGSIA